MSAPSQMFEYGLNVKMGNWLPNQGALLFSAKLSAEVTFTPPAGRAVHVDEDGEFQMGLSRRGMGLFLWNAPGDLSVDNPGTTPRGTFMQQPVLPRKVMTALVASGCYEVENTEYDADEEYAIGELLTAAANNTDSTVGGVLTTAGSGAAGDVKQFVDPVCGVLSRGEYNNEHGIPVICYWTVWLPGSYV